MEKTEQLRRAKNYSDGLRTWTGRIWEIKMQKKEEINCIPKEGMSWVRTPHGMKKLALGRYA